MPDPQQSDRPATWQDVISAEATKQGIDPRLALAVAETESNFNPAAKSPKGAIGLMQLMPATAAKWQVDPNDPVQNIRGGVSELKALSDEHKGDVTLMLRRYNGSPRASEAATQPYGDQVRQRIKPSTSPGQPPPPPSPTYSTGRASPATTEEFTRPKTLMERVAEPALGMLSSLDPRTAEGRRNIGGGVGAMAGAALTAPSAIFSGPVGPGTGAMLGAAGGGAAVSGAESLYHHLAGTPEEGAAVGTPPPTLPQVARSAAGAGLEQGAYEVGGRVLLWPVRAAGRQLVASRVGRFAAEQISSSKAATLGALQTALDSSQQLFRAVKAGAKSTAAGAETATRQTVSQAAGGARQAVAGAVGTGATQKAGAEEMAAAGVKSASEQATAGEAAARGPYEALVGAPPPSAAAAGQAAHHVIQEGGAQTARNAAGQAVDAAAKSGPDVDITGLKAEAQRILEQQIKPPAETFPRRTPEAISAEEITAQSGIAPDQLVKMQEKAAAGDARSAANLADLQAAVASAQGEGAKETLKHPALAIVSRLLNAGDTVSFHDAHLLKVELDNAIRNTRDQAVRSQVASLTQHLTGGLRSALKAAGHQPYEQATAAYAKIAPLYTKGIAPRLRKLVVEEPEAVVRLLSPAQPTRAAMLVDLLTHQAEAGGGGPEGRAALEAVQSAWVRQKLINGGIEKLGDRVAKLPPEFVHAFLSDPKAQAVLDNLKLISTAYNTAVLTGEQGIQAAKTAGKGGVEAAGELAAQRTGAVRETAHQAVEGVRQQGAGIRSQVARANQTAVEQAREAGPAAAQQLRGAKSGIRSAEDALASSSIGPTLRPGSVERRGADVLRAMIIGPSSIWGGISLARLLHGPTAQDLVHYAAASPYLTRKFVGAITSPTPALALADLGRTWGILGSTADVVSGRPPKAPTPPPAPEGAPIEEGVAARVGAPPPR